MIQSNLTTLLTTAGATVIIYESEELANVQTDKAKIADIIGLIQEPKTINLEPRGNGIDERYNPIVVEVLKQSPRAEAGAVTNEAIYDETLAVAKAFVLGIIRGGGYKKLGTVPATRVTEKRYDANLIGWSLSLILVPVTPELNC